MTEYSTCLLFSLVFTLSINTYSSFTRRIVLNIFTMSDSNNNQQQQQQQPQGSQPGLIGSHYQYAKGAAEVLACRPVPSQTPLTDLPPRPPSVSSLAPKRGRPQANKTRRRAWPR